MSTHTKLSKIILTWIVFIFFNFLVSLGSFILLLTPFPNPYPVIIVILFFSLEIFYFKHAIGKAIVVLLFLYLAILVMMDTTGAVAIAKRCSYEANKPFEERNVAKIEEETKNFDSCLNSMTFGDKFVYGLLKE